MATCRVCTGKGICPNCNGVGTKGGVIPVNCPTCRGKRECPACRGQGWRN
ncbi:hypothetical protein Acsp07_12950 [Actinomycetospora sp. NBRC 106378]|nr:hypothetical protein Acsp07_12950 [Actinomycetospora sp. NBRC 106378]